MNDSFYSLKLSDMHKNIIKLITSPTKKCSKLQFISYYKQAIDIYKSIDIVRKSKSMCNMIEKIEKDMLKIK